MLLSKDVKLRDVTGEELSVHDLIGRLIYRQGRSRVLPDLDMSFVICWQDHFQLGVKRKSRCQCESEFRYVVVKGVVVRGKRNWS
jgi:hypothetical protein